MPGHRGARPVGRQRQLFREPGEPLAPVGQFGTEDRAVVVRVAQDLVLPQGVVAILHRQRCPLRAVTGAAGRVGRRQVADQGTHRPAVADDVVLHQDEHLVVLAEHEQLGPEGPVGGEVERRGRRRRQRLAQVRLGHGAHGERHVRDVEDPLARGAVQLREDRPQDLVPAGDVGQRAGQRAAVEPSGEPQRADDGVPGVRAVQLVEEPEPLLGVGKRDPVRNRPRAQGGPDGPAVVDPGREPGDRRVLEQVPDPQFGAERGPDAADQARRQQGVPAEVEEPVVDPDATDAEQFGVQPAKDLFGRVTRRAVGVRSRLRIRCGQGPAVDLPVGRQRELGQDDDGGRNHVLRQDGREVAPHVGRPGVAGAVHHEPPVPRNVLAHDGDGLGDPRVAGRRAGDFAGFDALAAQLDLVVGAAEVLQFSPRASTRTRSPVRYIRAPGPPAGSGTNRSAVRPGRCR